MENSKSYIGIIYIMFNRESIRAAFIIRSPLYPPQVNFVLSPCLLPSWVTKRFKITLLTFETLDLASQPTSVHRGISYTRWMQVRVRMVCAVVKYNSQLLSQISVQ